ncbi:hypothetical protein YTXLTZUM_CDS0075 [Enterococcus phage VRE9_3]
MKLQLAKLVHKLFKINPNLDDWDFLFEFLYIE